jgi:hypothetical protein
MKNFNQYITEKIKLSKDRFSGKNNGYEWVDLELPSGTLWAKCNIGANEEHEYGDYFAWGETAPKKEYTWDTSKFCKQLKFDRLNISKYSTVDKLEELEPEDDAAHVNIGNGWSLPTADQVEELIENTTNEWVENYNDTGINGRLITGKNGNTLFLPAGSSKSEYNDSIGKAGEYWTKTLSYYQSDGVDFQFSRSIKVHTKNNPNVVHDSNIYLDRKSRYYGLLIRPVLNK